MKIKITEDQARRLKLITENSDVLLQFEELCKAKIQEINTLYNRVTSYSIYEILHKEIDMAGIYEILDKIENEVNHGNRKAYSFIKNSSESDLDIRIDNAHDRVTNKLTPLQIIVMDLEKLQLSTEEHDLTNAFKDIKPIDITDYQK
jgi:hypothetical protein